MRSRGVLAAVAATGLVVLAAGVRAEERWAVWPPTFYDTAEILLATSEPAPVAVQIKGPGLDTEVTVSPDAPARVALPGGTRIRTSGVHPAAAWRLNSAGSFTAILQTPATRGVPDSSLWTSHDATLLPSVQSLGDTYRALSWPGDGRCYGASGAEPCADSWLVAVAIRDGTLLTLEGSPCSAPSPGDALQAGDAFALRCRGSGEDVTGVRVRGSTDFLLLSGASAARLPADGSSADNLLTAPLPEEGWGTLHHVLPVPGIPFFADEGDQLRIVGDAGTEVRIDDGEGPVSRAIPSSGVLDLDGAIFQGRPLQLVTDRPVSVAQLMKSRNYRGLGDPSLAVVPPARAGCASLSWPVPDGYGEGTRLLLVTLLGAEVRLDGAPPLSLSPLPGGSHGAASVELSTPTSESGEGHVLRSTEPVVAWVASQGIYKSYHHALDWLRPSRLLRGGDPQNLSPVARDPLSPWRDDEAFSSEAPALLFYRLEGEESLVVRRVGPPDSLKLYF